MAVATLTSEVLLLLPLLSALSLVSSESVMELESVYVFVVEALRLKVEVVAASVVLEVATAASDAAKGLKTTRTSLLVQRGDSVVLWKFESLSMARATLLRWPEYSLRDP